MIKLNPLKITGNIEKHTPIVVILEIAKSLGIIYDKTKLENSSYIDDIILTINSISESKMSNVIIGNNYSSTDLQYIARFVNSSSKITWRKSELIKAFNHLLLFYNINIPPKFNDNKWNFGSKTTDNPYSYNAMMLYKICLYYTLYIDRNTTIEIMSQSIRLLDEDINILKNNITSIIEVLPKTSLISLLTSPLTYITPKINDNKDNIEYIDKIEEKFSIPSINPDNIDINIMNEYDNNLNDNMLIRINPINQYESIILAARVYFINLTECKNPFIEYKEMLKFDVKNINQYIPIDKNFKKRYMKNPLYFNVKKTYAYKIPSLYNENDIIKFLKNEGYDERDILNDTPINLLHIARLTSTFHIGRHPNSNNKQTLISLDDIDDIDSNNLISYGISESIDIITFSIDELIDNMINTKTFVLPHNPKERFSQQSLKKLKCICNSFLPGVNHINNIYNNIDSAVNNFRTNPIESFRLMFTTINGINTIPRQNYNYNYTENMIKYKKLLETIELVEQYDLISTDYANRFRLEYINSNDKDLFINVLTKLLHCGAYMRAWKVGSEEIPITSNQCIYDISRQGEIDLNVTKAIKEYEKYVLSTKNDLFINLPLMKLLKEDGKIKFQASTSYEEGITVADRLSIVKDGKEIYSCIRTSSNFFMYTVYYFTIAIGLQPPFNIHELTYIS